MIRAVISDFGGVLTSPLYQAFLAYEGESGVKFEDLGKAMHRVAQKTGGEYPLFRLEKGEITEREFLGAIEAELDGDVRLDSLRETYFAHLSPNEPMIDYMRELRGRGLRMAILTNNVREWEPHWRGKLPAIDEIFEVVVDSAFVGMRKPDPRIYELTVERLGDGLAASECAFVDDNEPNVDAARELGMSAVHFTDTEQARAELEALLAG
ncbi:MAG TPA: HAD family phosphatase [Thermoleophilaceae bacterium]|nr:HAD family phosphatase [Thermoleophilaceae bacterium]